MKIENDFTKTNDENGEVKTSKWGYVVAFLILAAVVFIFAPFEKQRIYEDSTEIRLVDLVLVNFEWKAEYKTPLLVVNYDKDRQRFERDIEAVVGNYLNRIIRTCIDSKQLYIVGKDSIQIALYESEKVRELPVDTIIITEIQFEQRFIDYIAEQMEIKAQQEMLRQRAITDSIAHLNELKRAKAELEVMKVEKKIHELKKK